MCYEGYVRINGVLVWHACRKDGVNILLMDLSTCTVTESRHFSTQRQGPADELREYLELVDNVTLLIGVTVNDPALELSPALQALQTLGVSVSDVGSKASFAFVAQKGIPQNVLLKKTLDNGQCQQNEARLDATVAGISTVVT